MTKQIKVFFVFLTLLAIASVFSFFDVLGGVKSANFLGGVQPLLPIEDDVDQDGLSNADESYWNTDFQNPDTDGDGFLDGEEIASGFDPRVANTEEENDNLNDLLSWSPKPLDIDPNEFNITDNFTRLIAGGIAAGDLMPDTDPDKKDEALNYLSLAVIDNYYQTQTFQPPSTRAIDNSSENQTKYLSSLADIIKEDLISFPSTIDFNTDFTTQSAYFTAKGSQFNLSFTKVAAMEVPEDWIDIHNGILSLLYRFSLNYKFISNFETDPLKAVTALNEIANLNFETQALLNQIQLGITANKLSLDDDIYQVLNLVYKTRD